jgi:hypothetical protein
MSDIMGKTELEEPGAYFSHYIITTSFVDILNVNGLSAK